MDIIKTKIRSDSEMNKLFELLLDKNETYWNHFKKPDDVLKWLDNFSTDREIYLALKLAKNILFYTQEKNRTLWKKILNRELLTKLVNEKFSTTPIPSATPQEWFKKYVEEKIIFIGFGKAGKSGQNMVYPFIQAQETFDLCCMEFYQFLNCDPNILQTKEIIVLLDDFVGSGDQAHHFWYNKLDCGNDKKTSLQKISLMYTHLKFYYLALVGCKEGKEFIESTTPMKVILGEEIDERWKCFSTKSVIYPKAEEREEAKEIMKTRGKMLYHSPLGYRNMQLAIAFCHNTPDNSLPVIWKHIAGVWEPLFKRFE